MELKMKNSDQLQILAAKTWDLHGKINEKIIITQNGFRFCSHCSNLQREKMLAIRDSLRNFHDILMYLQRLKSSHMKQMEEALANLEKSRKILIEVINQFPEKLRKLDVIEELITFLGDEKDDQFPWDYKEKMGIKTERKSTNISSFLVHTTKFVLEFAVVFASIFATVELCKNRSQKVGLKREIVAPLDSKNVGKFEFLISDEHINLDVLCGRG